MDIQQAMQEHASSQRAELNKRYFKTGKGEYGEGDIFIGLSVPHCRLIAKQFSHLSLGEIERHISSKIHEERLIALLLLVKRYDKNPSERKAIVDFYLHNRRYVNNWDLVDSSADKIIGAYLLDRDISLLKGLAQSKNIWDRRIAVIATFAFIKKKRYSEAFRICEILMDDKHDLIHKASGWMLREVGKKSGDRVLEDFLRMYYKKMPRTMLRYAIERFPEAKRKAYLKGEV